MVRLFRHQREAREFFRDKDEIALFFEMGTGKTLTSMAIAADKFKDGRITDVLVIAPNGLHGQWRDEIEDGASVVRRLLDDEGVPVAAKALGGSEGRTGAGFEDDGKLHVLCVNIDMFSSRSGWCDVVDWANGRGAMIILDEASVIKNPHSNRSHRLLYEFNDIEKRGRAILRSAKRCQVRCVLTGTPVSNGLGDLWPIMEFVSPGFFGKGYYGFLADCREEGAAERVRARLSGTARFARLADCLDMPGRTYVTRRVGMSRAQRECYESMRAGLTAEHGGASTSARSALVAMLRLQQIASGFIVPDGRKMDPDDADGFDLAPEDVVWLGPSCPRLDALMDDVEGADKPLIIFTRFTAEAVRIHGMLKGRHSVCLVTGTERSGSVEGFRAGRHDIMVANVAKVARGFNLQRAHTTLYYSNTFSMELREQSEFRTFRAGQDKPCVYVDYVCAGIDDAVVSALQKKKEALESIRARGVA